MSEDWQEIRLKKAILNSVIMLLNAMEFSPEESAIEHNITIAIKSLKDAGAAISPARTL
jgi:alanine racemase